jgi:hypothetical protein
MNFKDPIMDEFGIVDPMIQWDNFWTPCEDILEYKKGYVQHWKGGMEKKNVEMP